MATTLLNNLRPDDLFKFIQIRSPRKDADDEKIKNMLLARSQRFEDRVEAKFRAFVLRNIISNNTQKYANTNLFILDVTIYVYNYIMEDVTFKNTLSSINSQFYLGKGEDTSRPWAEIDEFYDVYKNYVYHIEKFAKFAISGFDNETPAAGMNSSISYPLKCVTLNSIFFGTQSKVSVIDPDFGSGKNGTEVLVHETGHNAAAVFHHTTDESGDYEYKHTGLQSNRKGKIYPTDKNTLKIINDPENRENMKIQWKK